MKHASPHDIYPLGGVRLLLREQCKEWGGIRAWARLNGISPSHVSRVINGFAMPGPMVLMALNLRENTVYVPTRWVTTDQQPDA